MSRSTTLYPRKPKRSFQINVSCDELDAVKAKILEIVEDKDSENKCLHNSSRDLLIEELITTAGKRLIGCAQGTEIMRPEAVALVWRAISELVAAKTLHWYEDIGYAGVWIKSAYYGSTKPFSLPDYGPDLPIPSASSLRSCRSRFLKELALYA
jgi:hypothetical protein